MGAMAASTATVVVSGGSSTLGARVLAALGTHPSAPRVVDLDRGGDLAAATADLGSDDVLVHLGVARAEMGPDGLAEPDPAGLRKQLEAAPEVGRLVVLSSAMAYGAWPGNPMPLTEEAPLRPDLGYDHAARLVEVERLVGEWRLDHPGAAAVLRPPVTVAAESAPWLALSPWSAGALRATGTDRASQFLHLDDLAAAVVHAWDHRLDGSFNVAPDGWLSRDALADLAGPVGRLHLPPNWMAKAKELRARLGVPTGSGADGYAEHSWVVANDKLRATGWEPEHRNDEVYVEADPGGPLADLSPRRRQELSLAAAGLGVVGLIVGAVVLVRRRTRLNSSDRSGWPG